MTKFKLDQISQKGIILTMGNHQLSFSSSLRLGQHDVKKQRLKAQKDFQNSTLTENLAEQQHR